MNILFACGGTGGHINPALAVAKLFRDRRGEANILFGGASGGMETELVPREGFEIRTVEIGSVKRKITGTAHNVRTLKNIAGSLKNARAIMEEFRPDIAVGTGGYASFPFIFEASRMGIPTVIHESNAAPGLTTRILARRASRVMVSFPESAGLYGRNAKITVTGTPVREEFIFTKREDARKKLGIPPDMPMVVSCWGSLGAREMNRKIAEFIRLESEHEPFYHVHATGSFGWRWMPSLIKDMGVDLSKSGKIFTREYIYNMPELMAAADLVICRAGASTLSEISALAKPSIIVPSPNVAANHQEKNARALESRGAAKVLLENECSGEILFELVVEMLSDKDLLLSMSQNLLSIAILDAADRIYNTVLEVYNEHNR